MSDRAHMLIVRLEPSPPRIEWCDQCLVSHAFIDVLNLNDDGVSIVGTWADHGDAHHA